MLSVGTPEFIVIVFIAIIVVGPKRLPEIMRFIGRINKEIKTAINSAKAEMEEDFDVTSDAKKSWEKLIGEDEKEDEGSKDKSE